LLSAPSGAVPGTGVAFDSDVLSVGSCACIDGVGSVGGTAVALGSSLCGKRESWSGESRIVIILLFLAVFGVDLAGAGVADMVVAGGSEAGLMEYWGWIRDDVDA